MTTLLIALFATLFLWWFSTGLIFYAAARDRRSYPLSMGIASLIAIGALVTLVVLRDEASASAAFIGFGCGLVLWGWHEASFLMGYLTGPRSRAQAGETGFDRFLAAASTVIWHEIAIAATVVLLLWLTWGSANAVGTWTFVILWLMRLSAKLNLFAGVPHFNDELLPAHLDYLRSFFRKSRASLFFPISVTAGTISALIIGERALGADPGDGGAVAAALYAVLLSLALVEHLFMVLPLRDAALWRWIVDRRPAPDPVAARTLDASSFPVIPVIDATDPRPLVVRNSPRGGHGTPFSSLAWRSR